MRPWRYLNLQGRLLLLACCLNVYAAVVMAIGGSWMCVFSICMAAFCGLMTYCRKYQIPTSQDINQHIPKPPDSDE